LNDENAQVTAVLYWLHEPESVMRVNFETERNAKAFAQAFGGAQRLVFGATGMRFPGISSRVFGKGFVGKISCAFTHVSGRAESILLSDGNTAPLKKLRAAGLNNRVTSLTSIDGSPRHALAW
jgi:hypothetical protein